ncbi:hypothetical protein R1flu_004264 [Riccia fluitans]|uniref:PROP1-like PPR domain-containing protein n=1 Tax=Riccia fluitans TaxID=41844 RepID=A0ABD1YQK9_9MARC
MDASRFQGLAVRPACNIIGCSHEQLQFFPGRGLQKFMPGLVVQHGRKSRGRRTAVVRASITTDVAAVAIAAATVLPVCWLYISKHKSSPTPASASFSPPVSNSVESAGIVTTISKSSTVLVEPSILSTPKVGDGSSYTATIEEFTEVLADLSLEDWSSDEEFESVHSENRLNSGSLASTPLSSFDKPSSDNFDATGGTVLHAPVAHHSSEVAEVILSSSTFDTFPTDSTGDNTSKLNSTEVNGKHVSLEGGDKDADVVDYVSNANGKSEIADVLSLGSTKSADLQTPINGTVRISHSAEAVQPERIKDQGDNLPLLGKPSNGDARAKNTSELKSTDDKSQEEALDVKEYTNGALLGSDTTDVTVPDCSNLAGDRLPEFLDENVDVGTGDGSEFNTRLQSIIQSELTNIEEKRAELEKSLKSSSDVDIRSVNGMGKARRQQASSKTLIDSTVAATQSTTSNLKDKLESTDPSRQKPIRLSEILPLDESADPDLCLKLYRSFLNSGRLVDCVLLLEEMDKVQILDTNKIHHSKFFKACQAKKAVKEAFRFMRLIGKPTLSTYNMLISVCREARDVDGGLRALSAAKKSGHKPDTILYTSLVSTCAKAGKLDIAFKVFHEMEANGVVANIQTYGSLIDGCARAGQIAKAFGVYGIMLSKPNMKADLAIFNTLINACGRTGAIERAFDVLADLKSEPYFLGPNHVTYGALISACARAGQVDRAFDVYNSMREGKKKGTPECYTAVVHACSHTGDLARARTVLEDMKTDGIQPDEIFFSALIDVAGHANEVDGAFHILDEMKHFGLAPKATTYSAVMGMCSNTGNWERALKVYEDVRSAGFSLTPSTFNALITALSNAKEIHKAFAVLEEMKAAGVMPDQITYSILLAACETFDEPDRAFDLYTNAMADGVVPNQAMCDSIIGICYSSLRKKLKAPEYTYSIGLVSGPALGAPYQQWTTWALSVYRQTLATGVTPTIGSLSLLLGCLRKEETRPVKSIFDDTMYLHYDSLKDLPASILDGDGLYDPRALGLFDEAASMGIVPRFNYTAGPMTLNAEAMPSYLAEVSLVSLLRGLRKRHSIGAQLFPVTILHFVQKKQTLTATKEVKELSVSGRSGQVMAALLRRLKIHYTGHESSGKLKISVASIRKWLKPTTRSNLLFGTQASTGLRQFGRGNVLSKGIAEQQRAIRSGESPGNARNMDFRSANPSTDLYLRQISQVREWEFRDDDFEAEQDNFPRNAARPTSRVNGVKRPQSMSVKAVNETSRKPRP